MMVDSRLRGLGAGGGGGYVCPAKGCGREFPDLTKPRDGDRQHFCPSHRPAVQLVPADQAPRHEG